VVIASGRCFSRSAALQDGMPGGRGGMSRSLDSVYGGVGTRFVGGNLRGVARHVVDAPYSGRFAASGDGSTLLVTVSRGDTDASREFDVGDGSRRRLVTVGSNSGPPPFDGPCRVWIAPDGFVFVADSGNDRVQVLTPNVDFKFHCFACLPGRCMCERRRRRCAGVRRPPHQRVQPVLRRSSSSVRVFPSQSRSLAASA
jgi:DNA-binding beta-propeller fold protein YncE